MHRSYIRRFIISSNGYKNKPWDCGVPDPESKLPRLPRCLKLGLARDGGLGRAMAGLN